MLSTKVALGIVSLILLLGLGCFGSGSHEVSSSNHSSLYDSTPVWPLCGRIAEDPPPGWRENRGCPAERWGNPDYADFPLSTTFGPRRLKSQGSRYDFHRGIDIPTPIGTPVFAMASGIVRIAGHHSSFSNTLVQIRHFRPDSWGDCQPDGCYHSLYLHLSSWVVKKKQVVEKGELIGYSGKDASAHVHLEIRDAQPEDPQSAWQRDAIHPLRVLPYHAQPEATQATITNVDVDDPMSPIIEVVVREPAMGRKMDFNRLEIEIYDNTTQTLVPQPGMVEDGNGYHVYPPYFDIEQRNLEYTHKNSSLFPWSSFDTCPFSGSHGGSYNAHVHTCKQDPDNYQVGLFNGIRVYPAMFQSQSADYEMTITFDELTGVGSADDLCIVAKVKNARGASGIGTTWNCAF